MALELAVTVKCENPEGVPTVGVGCVPFPPPQLATNKANAIRPKTAEHRRAFLAGTTIPAAKNPNMIASDHKGKVRDAGR